MDYKVNHEYLKVALDLVCGRSVLLDDSLVGGVSSDALEFSLECNLGILVSIRSALLVCAADLL